MELEINEPYRFLGFADDVAQRFAEAIMHMLSSGNNTPNQAAAADV